jgi:hypothetical protein
MPILPGNFPIVSSPPQRAADAAVGSHASITPDRSNAVSLGLRLDRSADSERPGHSPASRGFEAIPGHVGGEFADREP